MLSMVGGASTVIGQHVPEHVEVEYNIEKEVVTILLHNLVVFTVQGKTRSTECAILW